MALANLRVQLAGLMNCTCRTMLAELENSCIHSQCVSYRMTLNAGIRRMNLDVGIRRMLIFPYPQIVEEISEPRNPLIKCTSNSSVYFEEIEVFPT